MECSVCVEKYNQTFRKRVECAHCKMEACRQCHKKYILQSIQQPHCMGCKIPWNVDVILDNFTKSFFQKEYREHREKVLFEREKALLPETQQLINEENLAKELDLIVQLISLYRNTAKGARYLKEAEVIAMELGIRVPDIGAIGSIPKPMAVSKPRPVIKCIDGNCRGFIMSNNWRCGLCHNDVCSKCLKKKEDEHTCVKEDIETRNLLLQNTKPCPKCAVMIQKVSGCDHMWCVMCKTAFSWKTGECDNSRTTNPHYYDWLRRSGREVPREPGDTPAGQPQCADNLPHARDFERVTRDKYTFEECTMLLTFYRLWHHIRDVEYTRLDRDMAIDNTTLRKSFLKQRITEEEFKREVFIRERKRERSQAIRNVFEVLCNHLEGVLLACYNTKISLDKHQKEMYQLIDYCNECLKKIATTYNVKLLQIQVTSTYIIVV